MILSRNTYASQHPGPRVSSRDLLELRVTTCLQTVRNILILAISRDVDLLYLNLLTTEASSPTVLGINLFTDKLTSMYVHQ